MIPKPVRPKISAIRIAVGTKYQSDGSRVNTVSRDIFTATQFVNWYGLAADGWIQSGETVADLNNYGAAGTYWVYHCETQDGRKFVAGAKARR